MSKQDHLSKLRDALDEFIGDEEIPGTIEIDRPGKHDMIIIRRESFHALIQAAHRLNEIEGVEEDSSIDEEEILRTLQGRPKYLS
jgi:hypothetical protein